MLISHKHKFITIDIPKTGTRSLRESLRPLGIIDVCGVANRHAEFYQHDRAIRAKRQFKKNNWNWDDYFKFTIVRNPWCRYFSFFTYFKSYGEKFLRRDKSITWNEPEINQGGHCVSLFKDQDDHVVLKKIILQYQSQGSYYRDNNGEIIVDHIAEFENLANEFTFLCHRSRLHTSSLKHGNKSNNSISMNDLYDQELIDLVGAKEKDVIILKKYKYTP